MNTNTNTSASNSPGFEGIDPAAPQDERVLFEAAMIEAGYERPERASTPGSQYLYQRDQDRFVGWQLARAALPAQGVATVADEPVSYMVGNSYVTQAGDVVRFAKVHNHGTSYETMEDEHGVHRYTRRDFGRVTGTDHGYSDPRNTPPLYARPAPAQGVAPTDEKPLALLQSVREYLQEGIEAATGCEEADQDYDFANQVAILLHKPLYVAAPQAGVQAPAAPQAVPDEWIGEMVGGEWDDLSAGQGYRRGWNDCRAATIALTAQPAAQPNDALDAARWRWITKNRETMLLTGFFGNGCVNKTISQVEQHIDAARTQGGAA